MVVPQKVGLTTMGKNEELVSKWTLQTSTDKKLGDLPQVLQTVVPHKETTRQWRLEVLSSEMQGIAILLKLWSVPLKGTKFAYFLC